MPWNMLRFTELRSSLRLSGVLMSTPDALGWCLQKIALSCVACVAGRGATHVGWGLFAPLHSGTMQTSKTKAKWRKVHWHIHAHTNKATHCAAEKSLSNATPARNSRWWDAKRTSNTEHIPEDFSAGNGTEKLLFGWAKSCDRGGAQNQTSIFNRKPGGSPEQRDELSQLLKNRERGQLIYSRLTLLYVHY